ncbi:heavy metal-responsive transcriptional regulator [Roseofilum reptotaenium CS-1145]|uniref:Heavy metal-responsive transcriptional regulator n=1 Tax=Roseofilum reptotaenium AO1-A TaxID=1925591 RepID=A0A1L9QSA9_9CYAN|nr:heavy metal-responsive transcriptional regulator [Roseofilum reptotaenium]MDB9519633.1 heavy metal-responsive transcriptional regulator [Roseofilum reptotaenium CS-1145]OJJ25580.1 heavy metal-responsive transcriptional regulator [Roseofilum reptotaenium AO1-A]
MLSSQSKHLLIGQVKAQSGVPIKTIRYYEQLGLIAAVDRTEGGFRLFSPQVLSRLAFIRRSQHLGFSLQEIKQILQIHDQGELPCKQVRQNIDLKVAEIDRRIAELTQLKQELLDLVQTSPHVNPSEEPIICPIIQQSHLTSG